MTTPLSQAISVTRGDDYGATLTFDQAVAGFAEVRFTVRDDWATTETDDTTAVFSASYATGQIAASGTYTCTLDIPNAATITWLNPQYVYDVQVTTVSGKRFTTQRGILRVDPDSTRS